MKVKRQCFEKSLKLPKIFLLWAGIEIFLKNDDRGIVYFIQSWAFYFNFIWIGSAVIGEFLWFVEGVYMALSIEELSTCMPCFTVCILAIVKCNCLYFNRDVVINVVEKLRTIHPIDDGEEFDDKKEKRVPKNAFKFLQPFSVQKLRTIDDIEELDHKNERGIVKNALKLLKLVLMFVCVLNVAVVVVFSTAPLLSMAYDYFKTGHTKLKLPFRIKYFFDEYTPSRWPLIYIHQIGAMIIATIDLLSTDILFYTFCVYVQMHFRLLCIQFENFISKKNKTETRKNLRTTVKKHQELIELVKQIELLYSKSTLCNIILSSLLICLSGFVVTIVNNVDTVSSFVMFLLMNFSQISLLCYFGDKLNSASTGVSQAIYNSLWYDADPNIRKSVLIVLIRAQKPCKVTAMKFADLNVNALSAILRTSWSYFALLKTIYN